MYKNRKQKTNKKNIEWQKKEKKKDCQQIMNIADPPSKCRVNTETRLQGTITYFNNR